MKKSIYLLGIICLSLILIGTIFKASHFPGANILLAIGIISLSLIFMPISLSLAIKSTNDKLLKFVYTAAFISFSFDLLGMLFKVSHWPGANWFLTIGLPLPFVLFLPSYIIYHNKRKLKTDLKFFAILSFMIYFGVFSALLALNPNANINGANAKIANALGETNKYLEANNIEINTVLESHYLIKSIETYKQNLVYYIEPENKDFMYPYGSMDFLLIIRKNKSLSYEECMKAGLESLNSDLVRYFTSIEKSNQQVARLISEIEVYRVPKTEHDTPIITQLPLISMLNILTDWQNKILLIENIR